MELHSYAKHRAIKKWSIEQKRRLVEARINCDEVFRLKPKTSLLPWKKVIFQAKLDDFNAVFVRKQWANMVGKYMQYKQERLGNKPTHDIDNETVRKITQEWEFFKPIHRYMTRKTTNLHSYALKTQNNQQEEDQSLPRSPEENVTMKLAPAQRNSNSSNERSNVCSSDTNEECAVNMHSSSKVLPNTDHDFYSKKAEQQCYFADVEEDTLESTTMDVTTTTFNAVDIEHTQEFEVNGTQVYETKPNFIQNGENQEMVQKEPAKNETLKGEKNIENGISVSKSREHHKRYSLLSERDKYYRHKRRYDHRMECRFDAILNVFGQIAKTQFPNIDISPLEEAGGYLTSGSPSSSCSSDEDTYENDINNK